jgi:hypothetical protein
MSFTAYAADEYMSIDNPSGGPTVTRVAVNQPFRLRVRVWIGYDVQAGVTVKVAGLDGGEKTGTTVGGTAGYLLDNLAFSTTGVKTITASATVNSVSITNNHAITVVARTTPAPLALIDYAAETITGLVDGADYRVHISGAGGGDAILQASGTGTIAINSAWMNGTPDNFDICVAGNESTTVDGIIKTLTIPARPAAPNVTGTPATTVGGTGGISGTTTAMEISADQTSWSDCTGNENAGLAQGTYYVRIKAVASTSFASEQTRAVIAASTSKDIAAFSIGGANGTIIGTNIAVTVPYGTNVTSLMPTIAHTGASINPLASVARNFTTPVTYTVTAEDNSTKVYTVTVTVAKSSAKAVTSFALAGADGTINEAAGTIAVTVPYGTSVTSLMPTIIHTGAIVSPLATVAQDFTTPVTYTVTAEDNTTKVYTVTVSVAKNSAKAVTSFALAGATGTINEAAGTIAVTVPYGTSVTSLTPAIIHTGAIVSPLATVAQNFTNPVTYTVTAEDNTTKVYTVMVTVAKNNAKAVTSFALAGVDGTINEAAGTIAVTVPHGTNVTSLMPTIAHTGASISPLATVAQDFTNPVTYTVKAEDNSTKVYSVTVTVAKNSAKAVTSFALAGVAGTINEAAGTIAVTVPYGTNVASLTPAIIHTGAIVSPLATATQNFTNPVTYTVTAEDNSTKVYSVTVTVAKNNAKAVTSFALAGVDGTINEAAGTIAVTVPYGTNVTSLTPAIIHTGASVSPASSVAQDFTNPVTYTVTAEDNSTKVYTVTVNVAAYNNGGSSSSGWSSGSAYTPAVQPTPTTFVVNAPKAAAALAEMRSNGASKARIHFAGQIRVLHEAWQTFGSVPVDFDTLVGNAVQVRVAISNPGKLTGEKLLSGYVKGNAVDSNKAFFEKWFTNKVRAVHLDHTDAWGQPTRIAAKVDLTGMEITKLHFYSYDKKANIYRSVLKPEYLIDVNGYLHFTTEYAGDIIISEGALATLAANPDSPADVSLQTAGWLNPFTDVSAGDWFYHNVAHAHTNGLFSGTSADSFSPHAPMTRGMLVTVLGRMANADVSGYKAPGFTDVAADKYYAPYVAWAQENGIASGVGGNRFTPENTISRQDLAVLLKRYAEFAGLASFALNQAVTFADADRVATYAKEAAAAMQRAGVISGKPGNLFDPLGNATRAETAAMLHRFSVLFSQPDDAV